MSTDDSPQLGGLPADNAPMISSVETRVYATLRGAYQAGNLDALIQQMTPAQQLRFRQALVAQALPYAEQALPPDSPGYEPERASLAAARRWLADPRPELEDLPLQILVESAHVSVHYYHPDDPRKIRFPSFPERGYSPNRGRAQFSLWTAGLILSPLVAGLSGSAEWFKIFIVNAVNRSQQDILDLLPREQQHARFTRISQIIQRWTLDAAWLVLQDKEPPPLEISL